MKIGFGKFTYKAIIVLQPIFPPIGGAIAKYSVIGQF